MKPANCPRQEKSCVTTLDNPGDEVKEATAATITQATIDTNEGVGYLGRFDTVLLQEVLTGDKPRIKTRRHLGIGLCEPI